MANPTPLTVETITTDIHPLSHGTILFSPGCHFSYRVIGPCCRLFDREQLPWPCCRLQWRGKEPSWRRIGKRFIVDLATKTHPSYSVEIIGQNTPPIVITLYAVNLLPSTREWWYTERRSGEHEHENGDSQGSKHLEINVSATNVAWRL